MSALWWVPLILAALAAGVVGWATRIVAREAAALPASVAGLAELRSGLADVESQIAGTGRAVDQLDLR